MARRRPRRAFAVGEVVDVRREVGAAWEPATYQGPVPDMRGWHHLELPADARPRYVDMATLQEVSKPSSVTRAIRTLIAPTQRTRPRKVT